MDSARTFHLLLVLESSPLDLEMNRVQVILGILRLMKVSLLRLVGISSLEATTKP